MSVRSPDLFDIVSKEACKRPYQYKVAPAQENGTDHLSYCIHGSKLSAYPARVAASLDAEALAD